jgi:hypothetical protein
MSAALLSEPESNQGIEDDRESAFYVLLYLGLLYTKHNQVLRKLGSYVEIFDYTTVSNNVAEGGGLKRDFLVTRNRADALEFDCPPMNRLIKELRTTFSVRYVEPPSEDAFARYETMKLNPEVFGDALVDHPAAVHGAHKKDLRNREWFVKTIEKYLDDQDWPSDDAAELNPISRKRKREENSGSKTRKGNISRTNSRHMK